MLRLTDPEFLAAPATALSKLRAEGPLAQIRVPIVGKIWVPTTDHGTRLLLKNPHLFRRDPAPITGKSLAHKFWWMPSFLKPMLNTMIVQDDPEHRRQRHLVELAFARSSIEDMRPAITSLADRLLDTLPSGEVDIISAYTRPLPFLTICALLGVPESSHDRLLKRIAPLSHATSAVSAAYASMRLRGVLDEFRALFRAARQAPWPGLISDLATIEADGTRLSDDELLSITLLLFIAGHETTVHLINNAIVAMAKDDALRARFVAAPEERHLMIEEFVRYFSPVVMTKAMFVAEDTNILGPQMNRGDMVAALLIAANHDPARVEAPSELRADRRPNAHLGFGFGPHVCLGMQLARIETSIALDRLFARYPDLTLTREPGWAKRPGLRAPGQVHLRL